MLVCNWKRSGLSTVSYKIIHFSFIAGIVVVITLLVIGRVCFPQVDVGNIIFHIRTANISLAEILVQKYVICILAIFCFAVIVLYYFLFVYLKIPYPTMFILGMLCVSLIFLNQRYGLWKYICNQFVYEDFYREEYKNPETVKITFPAKKSNLIVLYLEAIEKTYNNVEIFDETLLPELQKKERGKFSLGHLYQMTGTGWSMAAVVAGSCGIGLNLLGSPNIWINQEYYLPNVICLQDILHKEGYKQFFIQGGSSQFAGLNMFLANRAKGKVTLMDQAFFAKNYSDWQGDGWGAKDRLMYTEAKRKISELAKDEAPFFVTMFTLDTHFDGYLDEGCVEKYGDFRDRIKCADLMAGDFIDWFQKQDFAKDTVLVVSGDHLAMNNNLYESYLEPNDKKRSIYFSIFNSRKSPQKHDRKFMALDLFPTILESLGAKVKGHCLGLGCSVLSSRPTLYEKYGAESLSEKLSYPSKYYDKFIFNY